MPQAGLAAWRRERLAGHAASTCTPRSAILVVGLHPGARRRPAEPRTRLLQYACAWGSRPSAESRLARVTWISPGQRLDWKKSGVPQRRQKLRAPAAEDWYLDTRSSPASRLSASSRSPPGDEPAPAHGDTWSSGSARPTVAPGEAIAHAAAQAAAGPDGLRPAGAGVSCDVSVTPRDVLNCQGSVSSRSSGNSRLRSTSGATRCIRRPPAEYAADPRVSACSRARRARRCGVRVLHRPDEPARADTVTCSEVALLWGTSWRASCTDSCEPYQ